MAHRIQLLATLGLFLACQSVFGQQVINSAPSPQPGPEFYSPWSPVDQVPPLLPSGQYPTLPPSGWSAPSSPAGATPPVTLLPPVEPPPAPPPKIWEGSADLGLAGNEGNSPTFNIHLGGKLKRKTEFDVLSSELDYHENTSNSTVTANHGLLDSRFEHLFQNSPWTWFVQNQDNYDAFKAFRLTVSLDAGLGYRLVKNEFASLTFWFGGGETGEFDNRSASDRYLPEVLFGLEGEYKISKRQKFTSSVEYRPDVTDLTNYRTTAKAAWEVVLDEDKHLSMKVSVLDQYDADAGDLKPNNLDYAVTLQWSL